MISIPLCRIHFHRTLRVLTGDEGSLIVCECEGPLITMYSLIACFCPLHVPIDRRDVVAWEHARLAVTGALPPVGVRVVQDLNEVSASEAQLAVLLRVEVEQGLHVCRMLQMHNRHV